jgi:hypothetical protein
VSSCQCVWFCGLPGTLTAVGLTWLGLGQPGVALLLVGELVVAEETSHGRLDALGGSAPPPRESNDCLLSCVICTWCRCTKSMKPKHLLIKEENRPAIELSSAS